MWFLKQIQIVGIGCIFLQMLFFCSDSAASDSRKVFVSILPQKYFTHKIAGDFLTIRVMVPKGANPATYEPKPRQMTALSKSTLYFAIGVPFESVWLDKFKAVSPGITVIHTENGIEKMNMAGDRARAHPGHLHLSSEGGHIIKDPHVWTSPVLVKIMAENIYKALVKAWPSHQVRFTENYQNFVDEIDQLDKNLKTVFAENGNNRSFMVFHPAWGYFAQAYGLVQLSIEIEGKEPKPGELARIIKQAKNRGIRTIFVQPQFSTQSAAVIAQAINGKMLVADPLAQDWEKNLRQLSRTFQAALE